MPKVKFHSQDPTEMTQLGVTKIMDDFRQEMIETGNHEVSQMFHVWRDIKERIDQALTTQIRK